MHLNPEKPLANTVQYSSDKVLFLPALIHGSAKLGESFAGLS